MNKIFGFTVPKEQTKLQVWRWSLDTGPSQAGGLGGLQPPQFSVDQLTLSRPGGTHYPHQVLLAPRIFRPCDGPDVCPAAAAAAMPCEKRSRVMKSEILFSLRLLCWLKWMEIPLI